MIPLIEAVFLFSLGTLAIANINLLPILPASLHTTISLYLIAELLFFIFGKFRVRILHNLADPPPPHCQVSKHLKRFLMLNNVIDIEDFLRGWYLDTLPPTSPISRTIVETLVTYGFYSVKDGDINQLDLKYQKEVKQFIKDVEKKWNVTFTDEDDDEEEMEEWEEKDTATNKKGSGEKENKKKSPKPTTIKPTNIKFMGHIYEDLRVYHKPLLVYAVTETLAIIAHILLFFMGFRRSRHHTFSVWTWQPKHNTTSNSTDVSLQHNNNNNNDNNNEGMVEHAFEAALDATSVVAAQVSTQHPHSGQQYHIVHDDNNSGVKHRRRRRRQNNSGSSGSSASSQSESGSGPRHKASSSSFTFIDDNPAAAVATTTTTTASGDDDNSNNNSTTTTPIVFLHGVGTGLLPYLHFIHQLMKILPSSPMIALEVPHVSLRLCWQAAAVDHVADAAITALKARGYSKACFIGHSYGTFVVSRICQRYAQYIHSTTLWDPVTMLICHPQLLYNFVYKSPGKKELFTAMGAADAVRVLCSRDLVIAHTFCRRFHWAELMLWPEELPERSLVILSGKDDLVPSEMVAAQLRESKHPAHVLYFEKLGHGGLLLSQKSADKALIEIEKMVRM